MTTRRRQMTPEEAAEYVAKSLQDMVHKFAAESDRDDLDAPTWADLNDEDKALLTAIVSSLLENGTIECNVRDHFDEVHVGDEGETVCEPDLTTFGAAP